MKIGICQLSFTEGAYKENMAKIEAFLQDKVDEKVDILCFPELSITGYDYEVAKLAPVDEREFFANMAKAYNQAIYAGYSIKEDDKYYDASGLFNCSGNLLAEYKKIHLFDTERDFFAHGSCIQLIEYKGWKIGFIICADLGFAELARILALRGCDLILSTSAWFSPYQDMFKLVSAARACENQLFLVSANRAKGSLPFCGNSLICNPLGEIMAQSDLADEDFITAELDLNEVKKGRDLIPWLKMRLPEVYCKNE